MKIYGRRLRLTPEEEQMIMRLRSGIDKTPKLERKLPKIFLTDIETAPLKAYIWESKTRYVPPTMFDGEYNNWFMLSWAGKWLLEPKIYGDVLTPKQAIERDDSALTYQLWKMLDEADIVVMHNGNKFDKKMMNMRFLLHGFPPPSPYKVVDTLTVSRSQFLLPSYKLSYIAEILGISQKVKHEGIDMWIKCLAGDEEALENMGKYNIGDIYPLEELYLMIRPWIKNHPNIGVYAETDEPVCPVCGDVHLHMIPDSYSITAVSKFQNYRCGEYGAISKKRTSALPIQVRRALVTGAPF